MGLQFKPSFACSILLITFAFIACSKKDDVEETTQNVVTYDSKDYALKAGMGITYVEENHYNIGFKLTDGYFSPETYSTDWGSFTWWYAYDAGISITLSLFSPGTESFTVGEFEFKNISDKEAAKDKYKNDFFFNDDSFVFIDQDGDLVLEDGEEVAITGGTVIVSGESPVFDMEIALELENGKTIQGEFNDEFVLTYNVY